MLSQKEWDIVRECLDAAAASYEAIGREAYTGIAQKWRHSAGATEINEENRHFLQSAVLLAIELGGLPCAPLNELLAIEKKLKPVGIS